MLACPWPLYANVLMKDAVKWRSSLDVSQLALPSSVEAAVNQLLDDVEKRLGVVFVSHSLAFITAAHNGLCEVCCVQCLIKSHHSQYTAAGARRLEGRPLRGGSTLGQGGTCPPDSLVAPRFKS